MRRSALRAAVLLVLLVTASVDVPTKAAAQESPDTTVITVSVEENGDAMWTVSYRYTLSTQEERDAFSALQNDIQSNTTTFEETFKQRLSTAVLDAENKTGRAMTLKNTSVTTSREELTQQETGVVTYTVTWTNFAATEQVANGEELRIGDSIRGLYVAENTRFTLRAPDGYRLVDVTPSPDSSTENPARAVWEGPTSFTDTEPRLVATTAPADNGNGGNGAVFIAAGIAVGMLLILVLLGILRPDVFKRGSNDEQDGEPEEDGNAEDGDDPALMRNEERVLALLKQNGGRMKQQAIVQETGWSDAKTSNVVNELQEEGKVDKFQLGRENVLSLPDVEVDPTDDLEDK